MIDLRERFRGADEIPAPDLWSDILIREPGPEPHGRGSRTLIAALALVVVAATVALLVREFGAAKPHPAVVPTHRSSPSVIVGDQIAFVRRTEAAGSVPSSARIYIERPDGSGLRQISPQFPSIGQPSWSPDGSELAFAAGDNTSETRIYIMNADGSGLHQVTAVMGSAPAWSPDGTQLVFEPLDHGGLIITNQDGTRPRRLPLRLAQYPFPGLAQHPGWTPDGRVIYFARSQAAIDGPSLLFRVDVQTGRAGPLYNTDQYFGSSGVLWVAWSPKGTQFATGGRFGFSGPCVGRIIVVKNVDGSGERRLRAPLPGCPDILGASWTPDGSHLLFWSDSGIYEINPNGTGFQHLISDPEACCAAWRPV
jgi:Tol biopolymer transport system component